MSFEKRQRKIISERSVNKTSGCDFWWFLRFVVETGVQESSENAKNTFFCEVDTKFRFEEAKPSKRRSENEMCGVDSLRINSELKCARRDRQQSHMFSDAWIHNRATASQRLKRELLD